MTELETVFLCAVNRSIAERNNDCCTIIQVIKDHHDSWPLSRHFLCVAHQTIKTVLDQQSEITKSQSPQTHQIGNSAQALTHWVSFDEWVLSLIGKDGQGSHESINNPLSVAPYNP